jgi:hypothetical protein
MATTVERKPNMTDSVDRITEVRIALLSIRAGG